ncbi:hypothetical protein [Nonomuraea fuscirosea]
MTRSAAGAPWSTRWRPGSPVSVIPLIVLSGALQRFWRAGLTEGSVRE